MSRTFCRLAPLLLAVCLAATAAPALARSAAVTYNGTLPSGVGDSGPGATPISVTVASGRVTDYVFFAELRCTDGTIMNMGLNFVQLNRAPLPLNGNTLSATVGNPTQGFGLTAQITATINGKRMSGTLSARAQEDEGAAPSGPLCTASYRWTVVVQGPVKTPVPAKPKPYVRMILDPVAIPVTASSYSYGIAVGNVVCAGGAQAFTVSTPGHRATLTCANTVHRPLTKAIMGLSAGATYRVRVQALKLHGRRRRGFSQQFTVQIPPPGSPEWQTIHGL